MTGTQRARIGMLTPSSNTVLEPVTMAMLRDVPDVSAHFARFRVLEISLSDAALGQFDMEPMLTAADLLADAKMDVIVWNGTAAGWMGFDRDEALCAAITQRTGIPATSSVLAMNELFRRTGARTFGLVTPYIASIQERIIANYAAHGVRCVAERSTPMTENFAFAEVPEDVIAGLCREVATESPDAISVYCTNYRGGPVAAPVEAATGVPVYDTVATALWGALRAVGRDPSDVKGWGRLFAVPA